MRQPKPHARFLLLSTKPMAFQPGKPPDPTALKTKASWPKLPEETT